jgi:hypothetical protein
MSHKQVFIATHIGAGGNMLADMISANRRIARIRRDSTQVYTDPIALDYAQRKTLEGNPNARMFVDRIVFNHELAHTSFYADCLFVFLVREPEATLKHLVGLGYTERAAARYYTYRLRRLCEMARRAKHSIVTTWDELVSKQAFPAIKELIGMKELNSFYRPHKSEKTVDPATVSACRRSYKRHLNYLRVVTRGRQKATAATAGPA